MTSLDLSIFLYYLVILVISTCKCDQLPPPIPVQPVVVGDTSPEAYPFHAVVKGDVYTCNGILISEDYVITPASCVYGSSDLSIFLGFNRHPFYDTNRHEPNGQIVYTDQFIIHEKFVSIHENCYLNNIALVKLTKPVKLTKTVQPGKLITKEEYRLLEGKDIILDVTGWSVLNTGLKFAKVKLQTPNTCSVNFGEQFFEKQENCVEWLNKDFQPRLVGKPVNSNGKIIGFLTETPKCLTDESSSCRSFQPSLTIVPFLDWISQKMQNKTTGPKQNVSEIDEKVNELYSLIKLIKKQQQTDILLLEMKLDRLDNNLQTKWTEYSDLSAKVDEQINNLKSVMIVGQFRQFVTLMEVKEEFRNSTIKITDELDAQKAQYETLSKLVESVDGRIYQDVSRLTEIENTLENIRNEIKYNKLNREELNGQYINEPNLQQPDLQIDQTNLQNLDSTLLQALTNITDHVNGRLSQLDNDIGDLKRALAQVDNRNENEEGCQKINTRIDLIEKVLNENIATIFKKLKGVKDCCSKQKPWWRPDE